MPCSYFSIKAFTMAALFFFGYKITCYTVDAINFVWSVEDYEDLDTEHFPLPEKCPSPPPYEPPQPYGDN